MNNLYSTVFRFLVSILLLGATQVYGQCPPPGFPQPGNTCPLAPILCENLDGYCATINNSNTVQSFPSCPGWTLNNDEWFAFFAGTTTITIQVTPLNCSDGQMMGLQGGIYAGCGPPWVPMDLQCACTESPFILTSNNFVVGQIYWIVLDGCQGNVCDYSIDVLVGSTVGVPPDNPSAITGPASACQEALSNYSIAPVAGATIYNWVITPPDMGTVNATNNNVAIDWSPDAEGIAQLCVTTENLCYENDTPSCIEVDLNSNPSASISGSGVLCFGSGDSTNLTINFSGEAPWLFAYTLNGVPQVPIETDANPYTLQVVQPGTYALQSVVSVASNCSGTVSGSVIIVQAEVTVDAAITNAQCGLSNGAIDVTPGGGTAPYTYTWSNGQSTEDLSNIPAGSYTIAVMDATGCIAMADYVLPLDTFPTTTDTIKFCPGESVTIGDTIYTQPGTVVDTIPSTSGGCDTIATYTLILLPQPTLSDTIEFCPGKSVTIGGNVYTQPGTIVDTISSTSGGCDTIATYTLILLPQPVKSETIEFCPGESVTIGGNVYTQPGTVVSTIPGTSGCDTIVTYTLQYITTPNSSVSINCANDISIITTPGTGAVVVNYDLPTTSSDCDCPGISLTLTEGLPSGGMFPVGTTPVCYEAKDSCGNTANCCFDVTVGGERPCDTKIVGCMKWELLTITKDAQGRRTYRIRATNLCSNKLIYTAFQLPNGIVAIEPANNSVYTAPTSNRKYDVRNPNYSPFYSIRFKSQADSIAAGQSDIFEYTLPTQAYPAYINVTARLYPKVFYSSHLSTILCPVGVTPSNREVFEREQDLSNFENLTSLKLFPNPTSGTLFADLSDWQGEQLQVQIFNSQGQRVQQLTVQASDAPQEIQLLEGLTTGLYFLEVLTENGEKQAVRFVLQH